MTNSPAAVEEQQHSGKALTHAAIIIIIGVFVLAAGLAIYHSNDLRFLSVSILGGSGIMALLLRQMRELHTRQLSTQILIALLPNLPPEQWIKVVTTFQQEILQRGK